MTDDFIDHRADVFVDGGRHDFPIIAGLVLHLCMEGGKCQRRVGIRAVEVYPKNLHESYVCFHKSTKFLSILLNEKCRFLADYIHVM